MLRVVEHQLITVITYAKAVEALSEAWRMEPLVRGDEFLFDTLYGALWDGMIVRLEAIWDGDRATASLRNLACSIKGTPGAASSRDEVCRASHEERVRLSAHRNRMIAHRRANEDLARFDEEFKLALKDVWIDIDIVKKHLKAISQCLGQFPFDWHSVEEVSMDQARNSLSHFTKGRRLLARSIMSLKP